MSFYDIKSMNYEQVMEFVIATLGEKSFRAKQLYEWMHVHLAESYDEMTNLPKQMREKCKDLTEYTSLKQLDCQVSKEDGTRKYLFELSDGNLVESVMLSYRYGNSVCISSQVGCKMGCRFCASTLNGWERNLTAAEMLEQVYSIQADLGERISNVVVMGTGEPLDNLDALLAFIEILTDEHGLHISQRNITVSTCGLVPQIKELAQKKLQITLALSLHASNQKKREELMPIAKTYEIHEVLDTLLYYFQETGRRVSIEYSLVAGQNDSLEDAVELAHLLASIPCHVNLIPVNPIQEREYQATTLGGISAFKKRLENYGINVTIRREMGRDIDGACGQLRRRYLERDYV